LLVVQKSADNRQSGPGSSVAKGKMAGLNSPSARSSAKAGQEVDQPLHGFVKRQELERNVQIASGVDDETADNFAKAILAVPKA
jgi:hypothetical protein